VCLSGKREYAAEATAPAAARNFGHAMVVAALDPAGWELADDMEVVVSELVSAALAAHPTTIELAVDVHYDRLDIALGHDGSTQVSEEPADAVSRVREVLLGGLTSALRVRSGSDGRTRTTAMLRCDPRFTRSLACRYRPSGGGQG
jgi:hypothetical protein